MDSRDKSKEPIHFKSYTNAQNPDRGLFDSFYDAFAGLFHTLKYERNFRLHMLVTFLVTVAGIFLKIHQIEWLAILLSIGLVLAVELINTSIETTIDLVVGEHYHPLAKIAKDVAAAAVVLTACLSVIIGIIIFIPYLWELLQQFIN